jgi:hypothetical protein
MSFVSLNLVIDTWYHSDEEVISMRTLAMSRYRRNHEIMEEALYHAAFGPCLPFLAWRGTSRLCFPGPEKTQAGDDEADLEKLQELLVRATFIVALAVFRCFFFR